MTLNRYHDPIAPARGMMWGSVFSLLLWAVILCGCQAIRDRIDTKPEPPPAPLPVNTDAVDLAAIRWLGSDYSKLPITAIITGGSLTSQLFMNECPPATWPTKQDKGKTIQAGVCLFYGAAALTGGLYEWAKPGDTVRDLANLETHYHGHRLPAVDERVYMMYVSVDAKQRSNIVEVERQHE